MHRVSGDIVLGLRINGPERPQADVERDASDANALGLNARQQFGREVQARRRRGGGAFVGSVDGLVALPMAGASGCVM